MNEHELKLVNVKSKYLGLFYEICMVKKEMLSLDGIQNLEFQLKTKKQMFNREESLLESVNMDLGKIKMKEMGEQNGEINFIQIQARYYNNFMQRLIPVMILWSKCHFPHPEITSL